MSVSNNDSFVFGKLTARPVNTSVSPLAVKPQSDNVNENRSMKIRGFNSNQEFYDFVDRLAIDLNELGFSNASRELHTILQKIASTTGSEIYCAIEHTLLKLRADEGELLPQCLLEDVDLCVKTIEDAWNRASR